MAKHVVPEPARHPLDAEGAGNRCLVHFVGFRDDRYWNAVLVWGLPDFIHPNWDFYALGDIASGDTVVHAGGDWRDPPRSFSAEAAANRAGRRQEPARIRTVEPGEGDRTHDR